MGRASVHAHRRHFEPRFVLTTFHALLARAAVAAGAILLALFAAEPIVRALDHYEILRPKLRSTRPEAVRAPVVDPLRSHVADIPTAPGVDPSWYEAEPARPPSHPLAGLLAERAKQYPIDDHPAYFEWNLAYLVKETCRGDRPDLFGDVHDFLYFEPVDGRPYPTYRHLRHFAPPSWFSANSFGWRGPDVALKRPSDTIRIAFVGASTTIDPYAYPFAHPELVGEWLNRWARQRRLPYKFEVINAGRTGIDSRSIAAIVRQELAPLDPDLVIYYEGANQFWPGKNIRYRFGRFYSKPQWTARRRTVIEEYSALAQRAVGAFDRLRGGDGREPLKPVFQVDWPAGLDEHDPQIDRPDLPMDLTNVVRSLDEARTAVAPPHGELAVASFTWLVYDGLRLDLARDLNIFRYLNDNYWPVTYSHMRRMADFQNRVFEKYARVHGLPYFDIAGEYPRDPALFIDAIHLTVPGVRLLGWLYLQKLVPLIEDRIRSGQWPRPAQPQPDVHPAFAKPTQGPITFADLKAMCAARGGA